MAKFYGPIGYAEEVVTRPGVTQEIITERNYYGDVITNNRRLERGEGLNDDVKIWNKFSIVADAYAYEHFFAIRYLKWMGVAWKISEVEVDRPRLTLTVGGIWNGQQATPTDSP